MRSFGIDASTFESMTGLGLMADDAVSDNARRIDELAAQSGLSVAPQVVQATEIAIDAIDADAIRPFWKAVLGYVDQAPADGARLVHSGALPTDDALQGGFFVPPMIFEVDDQRPRIAREEIFGPVMTVIPFTDTDEVIAMANDTEYGLAAAVWTRDIGRALTTAKAIRAGVVWINTSQPAPSEGMWGGYKQSGVGRELGRYALDAYLESKQIYVDLGT